MCLVSSFVGIICIGLAKPEELEPKDYTYMSDFEKQHAYLIGIIMALLCAMGGATIGVASRRLKEIHYAVIQFAYGLFAAIAMAIYLIVSCISARRVPYMYDNWQTYFMILLAAFLNMISQNIMTYSN